jgi:hypothetical protein
VAVSFARGVVFLCGLCLLTLSALLALGRAAPLAGYWLAVREVEQGMHTFDYVHVERNIRLHAFSQADTLSFPEPTLIDEGRRIVLPIMNRPSTGPGRITRVSLPWHGQTHRQQPYPVAPPPPAVTRRADLDALLPGPACTFNPIVHRLPDAAHIVVDTFDDGLCNLMVVNIETGAAYILLQNIQTSAGFWIDNERPVLSLPDGETVAVHGRIRGVDTTLLLDITTGTERTRIRGEVFAAPPVPPEMRTPRWPWVAVVVGGGLLAVAGFRLDGPAA